MADVIKESDEELVIVEEDPKKLAAPADEDDLDPDDPDKGGDERIGKNDDSDGTDAEREAIRERRRLEKLERKERKEKAITRDKTELDFLRKRNDELERRMNAQEQRAHQADLGSLAQQAAEAKQEAEMAERVIAKAVEAGNGEDVTKAMRYRDAAIAKLNQIQYNHQQTQQRPPTPNGVDDQVMQKAKQFLEANKWYDPKGQDEDSAIVLAVDQAVVKDGFDPRTDEYWTELNKRVARRLPERFAKPTAPHEERAPRGGPALGSGREHVPASTRTEVYLSPDRKQALIDAGVWDDPTLRMRYAKRYAEYDKINRA